MTPQEIINQALAKKLEKKYVKKFQKLSEQALAEGVEFQTVASLAVIYSPKTSTKSKNTPLGSKSSSKKTSKN